MSENKPLAMSPVFAGIEQAIKIWWTHLLKFVMVFVWSFIYSLIPLAVFAAMKALDFFYGQNSQFFSLMTGLAALTAILVASYFGIRGQIGAYLLIKQDYTGDEKEIFLETKSWFWSYLSLSLLTAVLVILWGLLLIIPGIIYAVFYSFAVYVLFFEKKTGRAAIKRSQEIISGYWWPVFGRFFLVGLLVAAVSIIIATPLDQLIEKSFGWYLYNSLLQVINFLIGPIFLIYGYNMYQELVTIKTTAQPTNPIQ